MKERLNEIIMRLNEIIMVINFNLLNYIILKKVDPKSLINTCFLN